MRVLHVAECLTGGVLTAIEGYIQATPNLDHIVLGNARREKNLAVRGVDTRATFLQLPEGHAAAIRTVADAVRNLGPDVVHAHSSFAGMYARVGTFSTRTPVVYTPHALSYGRPDFPLHKRAVLHAIERLLSINTRVFAACSVHEGQLLSQLNRKIPVVTVPNALPPGHPAQHQRWHATTPQKVGMVGRINEYRDPQRFLSIVRKIHRERPEIQFEWIGDGEPELRNQLRAAGVHVTGWLSATELQRRICELSVLVYTSRWDGFPMVILEAITARVPTIVADIEPLQECPLPARFSDPDTAAAKVLAQLDANAELAAYWDPVLEAHTFEKQRQALLQAYELATAS